MLGPTLRKYQQKSIIGPLTFEDKTDIIVHDQWDPISFKVDAQHSSMIYLRIQQDRQNEKSVAHEKTLQDITDRLLHLL
jgi:hypothetical protein